MRSIFAQTKDLVMLWNLYHLANATCNTFLDMSVAEYAILLSVCERAEGLPVKELRRDTSGRFSTEHYEEQLLLKELVERVRDVTDKRALAFRATAKGASITTKGDELLAEAFLTRYPGVTEAAFIRFADLMAQFSAEAKQEAQSKGVFPAEAVKALGAYRRIVMQVASKVTMSFAQVALLALCSDASEPLNLSAAAEVLQVAEGQLRRVADALGNRHYMQVSSVENTVMLTDSGRGLLARLQDDISDQITNAKDYRMMLAKDSLTELEQYLGYLLV